jgi:putative redox protein
MSEVTVTSLSNLRNEVRDDEGNAFTTDEPASLGGEGEGATPYALILGALGSCISMTVTLYARRKNWPLERVTVRLRQRRIHAKDCEECVRGADGYAHRIERSVTIEGDLDEAQRARLQEIAHKCPVHKMLTSEIVIAELEDRDSPE